MITNSAYPFTAYVLTSTMLIKKVELVQRSRYTGSLHETLSRHSYTSEQLHETAADAIAHGRMLLESQRAKVVAMQANIDKRAANLDKAAAKL